MTSHLLIIISFKVSQEGNISVVILEVHTTQQCWLTPPDVCPPHLVGSFQRFHQFPEAYQGSLINPLHVNSEMLPVAWITQDVIELEDLDIKAYC